MLYVVPTYMHTVNIYYLTIVVNDSDGGCWVGSNLHSLGNEVFSNGQKQLESFHGFNEIIICDDNSEIGSCQTSWEI